MRLFSRRKGAQAAMEFLTTYAWAIVIISIVLTVLFGFGVFNQFSFSPKAQTGSCSVYRPFGPYNVRLIALQGECQGELPQYAGQFNGQNSYVDVGTSPMLNLVNSLTIAGWVYAFSNSTGSIYEQSSCNAQYQLFIEGGYIKMRSGSCCTDASAVLPTQKWVFVTGTYDGSNLNIYVNGMFKTTTYRGGALPSYPGGHGYIGQLTPGCTNYDLNGYLANVQIYNTTLSASEIQALYIEGIGGTPLVLQNLVGWWPLNGDANDYSGNGNNWVPNNSVFFTTSWTNGYTPT